MARKMDEVLGAMASISLGPSKIVVGLDVGTTFTGFMFCQRRDSENIYGEYNWEGQTEVLGRPYCKTSTSSLYHKVRSGGSTLLKYGHPAVIEHMGFLGAEVDREDEETQVLLQKVKLQLAGADYVNDDGVLRLPWGLTVHQVLSDFVAEMKKKALKQIRGQLGNHIRESHIQWCLTVPAIWDAVAKEEMKRIAETAGLIGPGGSQHPLLIVLEPEAAALYCDRYMKTTGSGIAGGLQYGDTFLIADVGGGTTDLIVLQKADHKFREVVSGSGDLCGGTHIDAAFQDFLRTRIGPCFERYKAEEPYQALLFASWWEQKKRSFTGAGYDARLDLPVRLVEMWKEQDKAQNLVVPAGAVRDRINMSVQEVKAIFDPTVDRILDLIQDQLNKSPDCKYLFVVGGFAESPYLVERIKSTFSAEVSIVTPPNAGAAICQGAVLYGLNPSVISERTSRRTYGLCTTRRFRQGDPEEKKFYHRESGCFKVTDHFAIFVRAGEQVAEDSEVTHSFSPQSEGQRFVHVDLLNTMEHEPKWSTDPGVQKSASFIIEMDLAVPFKRRSFDVRMKFGRTTVEVTAYGPSVVGGEKLKAEDTFDTRFDVV